MEKYDAQNIADKIIEAIKKERASMTKLNVMVLGKTGVGKSTLINNVFNESMAETGIGKPITDSIRKYVKEDYPLTIYDTPGLELGGENAMDKLLKEVNTVMEDGVKTGDISNAIHCIWYCVSTTSHRFEEAEKEFINKFLKETNKYNVPVILVLTQAYSKKEAATLKSEIEKENLDVVQIIPVLASDYSIDEDYVAKAYGLEQLIDVMENSIPQSVRDTLIAVQKADIKKKSQKAQQVVVAASTAAAITGATPIPFADAAVLVPEQIAMLAKITTIFCLPIQKATLSAIISAALGTTGATFLGRTIVSGLVKLVPGAGSVVGGVISGGTAAAVTAALGEAYIGVMTLVANNEFKMSDLETENGKKMFAEIFKNKLTLKRDNHGKAVA